MAGLTCHFKVHSSSAESDKIVGGILAPDEAQPCRVVGRTMFWFGVNRAQQYTILGYECDKNAFKLLASPIMEPLALGYGFGGALAATHAMHSVEEGRDYVRNWWLAGEEWQEAFHLRLNSKHTPVTAFPYTPVCFYFERNGPGIPHMVFVYEGCYILKFQIVEQDDGYPASRMEKVYRSEARVIACLLPPGRYLPRYLIRIDFVQHLRTPEQPV